MNTMQKIFYLNYKIPYNICKPSTYHEILIYFFISIHDYDIISSWICIIKCIIKCNFGKYSEIIHWRTERVQLVGMKHEKHWYQCGWNNDCKPL